MADEMIDKDDGTLTVHELTPEQVALILAVKHAPTDYALPGVEGKVRVQVDPGPPSTETGSFVVTIQLVWPDGTQTREDYFIDVSRYGGGRTS